MESCLWCNNCGNTVFILFGSHIHWVLLWWEFDPGGLSWILAAYASVRKKALEVDPRGLWKACWWSWKAWEYLELEAPCSLVTFFICSRALGIPSILPWKDCVLPPRNSGLGRIVCLCYFKKKKKSEMYFLEEKWTCFWTFLCVVSLIENSVWRLIFNPLPFPLVLNCNIAFQAFQKNNKKEIFYYYSIFICSLIILDFLSIWNQRKITG